MNITWYGTAAVGIDDGKHRILFDPFIRRNKKLENPSLKDFTGADAILVTHGHFDHIADIPKIIGEDENVRIYTTKTPFNTLKKYEVPKERMEIIKPGDEFSIGEFNIKVYQGRHIDFDPEHIKKVTFDCIIHFPTFFKYTFTNFKMPEANEIVVYEVENGGKRVLVMGSYGCEEEVTYPTDVDVLIMPFGGSPKIKHIAMPFIDTVRPKCIIADHHDDAFPPLTRRMDAEGFEEILKAHHPETEYIVPEEFKPYAV